MKVLLLGDGNFSFTLALMKLLAKKESVAYDYLSFNDEMQVLATSFDNHDTLLQKYPESKSILESIQEFDQVSVLHGINAWELSKHFPTDKFQVIVWNHPHLGQEDFRLHRFLMAHFFKSVTDVLDSNGTICISLVHGQETRWDIVRQASYFDLGVVNVSPFDETLWPGYVVKRNTTGKCFKNTRTIDRVGHSMKSFRYHFKLGLGKQVMPVEVIEKELTAKLTFKETTPLPFECPICSRKFPTERGLETHHHTIHVLKLNGEDWKPDLPKNFHCQTCHRSFSREKDLWQHSVNKHSTIRDSELPAFKQSAATGETEYYPCPICAQAVVNESWGMEMHLETLKPLVGLDMSCPLCQSKFIETRALTQHFKFCRLKHED